MLISYIISLSVVLLGPFILAFVIKRRLKTQWRFIFLGVGTFLASQVARTIVSAAVNIGFSAFKSPFINSAPFYVLLALTGGLLAGFCEEFARYWGYWLLPERQVSWQSAVAMGVGHGGIEALLLGAGLTLPSFYRYLVITTPNVAQIAKNAAQAQVFQAQAYLAAQIPWHEPLAVGFERILAILMQIGFSLLIWRAVTTGKRRWLWLAVGAHAFIDVIAGLLSTFKLGVWSSEGIVLMLTAGLGALVYHAVIKRFPRPDETPHSA